MKLSLKLCKLISFLTAFFKLLRLQNIILSLVIDLSNTLIYVIYHIILTKAMQHMHPRDSKGMNTHLHLHPCHSWLPAFENLHTILQKQQSAVNNKNKNEQTKKLFIFLRNFDERDATTVALNEATNGGMHVCTSMYVCVRVFMCVCVSVYRSMQLCIYLQASIVNESSLSS